MVVADPERPNQRLANERGMKRRRALSALAVLILMAVALGIGYLLGARGDWRGAMHMATAAAEEAAVTARIETAYAWSDEIPGSAIDVDTQGAVVRLRGTVPSDDIRRRALTIAENTDGVERVENQLIVADVQTADDEENRKETQQ